MGRGRGVWKLCVVVLMRIDSSLDHVAGNRAGQVGLRDSRGQNQQDLVADYGVKANSQLPDLANLVMAMPFPGAL